MPRPQPLHALTVPPPPASKLASGNPCAAWANRTVWRSFWPLRLAVRVFCAAAHGAAHAHREVINQSGKHDHV